MWWMLLGSLQAEAQDPPRAEQALPALEIQGFRRIINDQIDAFRAADAEAAWRYVAPGLQQKFGSADRFLRMVRESYAPVYNPRSFEYGSIQRVPGGWGQWLHVVGPDGERVRALYLLEQQRDGTWRTMGCMLFPAEEEPPRA